VNLLIEGHLCETSTPFGVPAAARMIHKNVADDLRAQGKELHPAFTVDVMPTHQFEVGLIHQGCRLEGMTGDSAGQVFAGNSPKFLVARLALGMTKRRAHKLSLPFTKRLR